MSLRAENLGVRAGGKTLLQGVTVAASSGNFVALVGPNGSGKSTLLRCLSGIMPGTEGEIWLEGKEINSYSAPDRTRCLGYLPQQFEVPFAFTVAELLALTGVPPVPEHPALIALELEPLLETPLTRLSGGERQRAAIARALMSDVPLLLLDEPLAHLDPRYALRVLEYLQLRAQAGVGVVAVFHDLRLARRFCQQVWLLSQGALLASGPMETLAGAALEKAFGLSESDLLIFS
jgi:iron complex transport system ATP-binding protein